MGVSTPGDGELSIVRCQVFGPVSYLASGLSDVSQYLLDLVKSPRSSLSEYTSVPPPSATIYCTPWVRSSSVHHPQAAWKNPEDHPDANTSQSHVQIALRMEARNVAVRAGDVVPYIFSSDSGHEDETGNT